MKFKDLASANWSWHLNPELVIFLKSEQMRNVMNYIEAVKLYGNREVRFFHDDVVYLL